LLSQNRDMESLNKISNKGLKVIEWGYEDQQNMKQVTNNTNKDIMINSREGIEKRLFAKYFKNIRTSMEKKIILK